jgi:hypothetical protein
MRTLLTVFFLSMLFPAANGQRTSAAVHLELGFPQGEYKSTPDYPKTGIGIRFNLLHRISDDSPFSVGGDIGYMATETETRDFELYYGGYYDTYRVSASSNIVNFAFKVRADLLPKEKPVLIFVEGTVGTNLFYSAANVQRLTYYGGSQYVDADNTKGYWAFTWGPGAGIEVPVGKNKRVAIAAKAAYLFGSNTTYLTDPNIDTNSGTVYFTQNESKTDMVLAELGARFALGKRR